MSWEDTILRQYSASQRILAIIDTFDQAVSLDDFTDDFISEVWDVTTAGTYGLDVWGKIVNISRYVVSDIENEVVGFDEANDSNLDIYPMPFNTAPFFGGDAGTTNVRLGDDAYRTLILCKAFSNISIATIPEINRFLTILFAGRGVAYCTNLLDMHMGINVTFALQAYEQSILQNYDVMPIPSGVSVVLNVVETDEMGFADGFYGFGEGTFAS